MTRQEAYDELMERIRHSKEHDCVDYCIGELEIVNRLQEFRDNTPMVNTNDDIASVRECLNTLAAQLQCKPFEVPAKIAELIETKQAYQAELAALLTQKASD